MGTGTGRKRARPRAGAASGAYPGDDFFRLVERASDLVMIVQDGLVAYANPAACAALGYAPGEIVGKRALDFAAEDEREGVASRISTTLATGEPNLPAERRLLRKDGASFLIEGVSFSTEFGGAPAAVLMGRDLTEPRRHLAELHDREQRLRALFDAAPIAILTVGPDRRLTGWNKAAREWFQWPDPDEHPDPWPPFLETTRGVIAALCEQAEREGRAEITGAGQTWVGKEMHLQVVAAPLRTDTGAVSGFVLMAADLTALHRAHEEAARSETVRELGEMVGAVAHEVRNPLFAMGATLDALRARFGVAPEQEPFFAALREELDRLATLMRDLLEFGRPPAVDLKRWNVAMLVHDAVRACRETAARAGVRVEDATAADAGEVLADGLRLELAFRNVVDNAIQHSRAGSEVRVEASRAPLPSGPAVEVRVLDRGHGFAEEDLPRVFEPFFTRRRGGTGLGLPLVRRVVEAHGGTVQAANRDGGGAAVAIRLPLAPTPRPSPSRRGGEREG